jgi:hypothetical protein
MEYSNPVITPTSLPTRLQRFKDVCLEKRVLKGHIEKLMEKREALAVREFERAENELERIKANAAAVRAQMEESRLADVGDRMKNEEATNSTFNGPLNTALLSQTGDLEGGAPSLHGTLAVKGSIRTSISFKSAESPILLPSSHVCSIVGSPGGSPFKLDRRRDSDTPTIPIAEEDGQRCEELLESEAQRYADLCEERRKLEMVIEEELAEEEKMASVRVELALSALQAVREKIVEVKAGLKRATGGTTVVEIPPVVSVDGPHGGDGLESALPPDTTIHLYSSEAKVNPYHSVSDLSTHSKSLHIPESPGVLHFAQPTLLSPEVLSPEVLSPEVLSPEETQATGSQIISVNKVRKKLTKKVYKQIERPRVVSQEAATPLIPKGILPYLGGE